MSFTHLQAKSGYSLMNSTLTIEKLVKGAKQKGFHNIALTDEHVLYGTVSFYKICKEHGINPIIGVTTYIVDRGGREAGCVLLAKNVSGYHSLIRLSTLINQEKKDNVTLDILADYTDGVVGILEAGKSHLVHMLEEGTYQEVDDYLIAWQRMFAQGDFYIGIGDHGRAEERRLNSSLRAYTINRGFSAVVALQDVRYLEEKDVLAFDCLQAIKNGRRWQKNSAESGLRKHHMRSSEEMNALFGEFWPEVIHETTAVAEKCNLRLSFEEMHLPAYPVPGNMDAHSYLEQLCRRHLPERYPDADERVYRRLQYELDVIREMDYSDYFLIVWDFVAHAKERDISVGPGRGSSASSVVAYVLGITDVDPLEHNLLFERFLNPERVSMPDIDVDFSDHRRDEVIDYVRRKYGDEHVAQIITFGTFQARSLVRELIKTMGIQEDDAHYILRQFPIGANQPVTTYIKSSDEFYDYIRQSETLKTLFAIAVKLEGLPRHVSTHAAGVVISNDHLENYTPLMPGTGSMHITQYPMDDLESIGLLKMDFLGLRNLTLLEYIQKTVQTLDDEELILDSISYEDENTFRLLRAGKTNGIFQLESRGMQQTLTRLEPSGFDDIVAVSALYRPGPMDHIPVYIDRKKGRQKVTYPHEDLAPMLEDTYGVLIYQEQIMLIAHTIAGFTYGEADILRRAVSKKNQDLMDEEKEHFLEGCIQNGYDRQVATEIFQWIVKFADYGFPKSHAVAYSKISYQLAYLKAHYPRAFFAELLSSVLNQEDKIQRYIRELQSFRIELLPPSINWSYGNFTVESKKIRMGFLSIKGIGRQVVSEIAEKREAGGHFQSLFDFCLRTSQKTVNRKVLESLIMVGAFDELLPNRASLLASIDKAMEQGELFREFDDQLNMFQRKIDLQANYVDMEDFSPMKQLADEKELLGFYISSHPLKDLRRLLQKKGFVTLVQASRKTGRQQVTAAIVVQSLKIIRTKRGDSMAFMTMSDETREMEAVIFPDVFRDVNRFLDEEMVVEVKGRVEERQDKMQWRVSSLRQLDMGTLQMQQENLDKRIYIRCTEQTDEHVLKVVDKIAKSHPGETSIIIHYPATGRTYQLHQHYAVTPDRECMDLLREKFGRENVVIGA